ncbi:hypothetical protein CIHG_03637 [Coccidioides immitis H538.4]|uniref:Uncharacterized protein n=2 Tax=Coccidioides immitis TaxID=5501 RepID=A0A0J8RLU7_COCIT|nr:hypothetical protein CIRG_04825 [Coccidioides immitis RMSCC 2394]KMU85596.1 hypothetical protein CIHG_03637 [Coccidioides immitis H538.4]
MDGLEPGRSFIGSSNPSFCNKVHGEEEETTNPLPPTELILIPSRPSNAPDLRVHAKSPEYQSSPESIRGEFVTRFPVLTTKPYDRPQPIFHRLLVKDGLRGRSTVRVQDSSDTNTS